MFLPLAHALARVVQMVSLQAGCTLAFWSGDSRKLVDDVGAAAPTHFPSVPRVFEKIHARVLARGSEGSAVKQRLFAWAIATGRKARPAMRAGTASAVAARPVRARRPARAVQGPRACSAAGSSWR